MYSIQFFLFNTFSPKVGTLYMSCSIIIKRIKVSDRANSKTLKSHAVPWKVKPVPIPFSNLCVDTWPLVLQVLFCLKKDKIKSWVNSTQQGQGTENSKNFKYCATFYRFWRTFKTQRLSSIVLLFIDFQGLSTLWKGALKTQRLLSTVLNVSWFLRTFNVLVAESKTLAL